MSPLTRTLLALTLSLCLIPVHAQDDVTKPKKHGVTLNIEDFGQNLPPVGSSLFDKMFSKVVDGKAVWDIPYPFDAVIARFRGDQVHPSVSNPDAWTNAIREMNGVYRTWFEKKALLESTRTSDLDFAFSDNMRAQLGSIHLMVEHERDLILPQDEYEKRDYETYMKWRGHLVTILNMFLTKMDERLVALTPRALPAIATSQLHMAETFNGMDMINPANRTAEFTKFIEENSINGMAVKLQQISATQEPMDCTMEEALKFTNLMLEAETLKTPEKVKEMAAASPEMLAALLPHFSDLPRQAVRLAALEVEGNSPVMDRFSVDLDADRQRLRFAFRLDREAQIRFLDLRKVLAINLGLLRLQLNRGIRESCDRNLIDALNRTDAMKFFNGGRDFALPGLIVKHLVPMGFPTEMHSKLADARDKDADVAARLSRLNERNLVPSSFSRDFGTRGNIFRFGISTLDSVLSARSGQADEFRRQAELAQRIRDQRGLFAPVIEMISKPLQIKEFSPGAMPPRLLTRMRANDNIDKLIEFIVSDVSELNGKLGSDLESLFPLGRSLQKPRTDSGFNPFLYPREIVRPESLQPEPHLNTVGKIKDRIFCGHLEPRHSMECISYNDEAGRYEFQLIEDYAPGKTPKVYYANRAKCISCHLNQAPLFAKLDWLESDDSFLMSAAVILENYKGPKADLQTHKDRLQQAFATRFTKIGLHRGADQSNQLDFNRARAGRYDRSILKAQELFDFQKDWIYGCGPKEAGNLCRSRLVMRELMLPHLDATQPLFGYSRDSLFNQEAGMLIIQQNIPREVVDEFLTERFDERLSFDLQRPQIQEAPFAMVFNQFGAFAPLGANIKTLHKDYTREFFDTFVENRDPVSILLVENKIGPQSLENCLRKFDCSMDLITGIMKPDAVHSMVKQGQELTTFDAPKFLRRQKKLISVKAVNDRVKNAMPSFIDPADREEILAALPVIEGSEKLAMDINGEIDISMLNGQVELASGRLRFGGGDVRDFSSMIAQGDCSLNQGQIACNMVLSANSDFNSSNNTTGALLGRLDLALPLSLRESTTGAVSRIRDHFTFGDVNLQCFVTRQTIADAGVTNFDLDLQAALVKLSTDLARARGRTTRIRMNFTCTHRDFNSLRLAIDEIARRQHGSFGPHPIRRELILADILELLGKSERAAELRAIANKPVPEKELFPIPQIYKPAETNPLSKFYKNCAHCHGVGQDSIPQYMYAASLEELQSNVGLMKDRMLQQLRSENMPPSYDRSITPEERNDMIKYLESLQ